MSNKVKPGISIFLMSLLFYMMVTTKYTHALGDYILEFIGLKPWTGDYSGLHLTIIYFGIPFIISIYFVEKYAVNLLNMKKTRIFLIFVVLMTAFYIVTNFVAINIKGNYPGLLAIGYNSENSNIEYRSEDNKITQFTAEFELTNYSDEMKTFYLVIDSRYYKQEINFYTYDGEKAIFLLSGNQTKLFSLNLNDYNVVGGNISQNGGYAGVIEEIILINVNDEDDKVKLNSNNDFFGELIQ